VAFSRDGTRLVSTGDDGRVRVWDAATRREARAFGADGPALELAAVTADGTRLGSASADGTVRVWDLATGRQVLTLKGHTDWGRSVVAFSPDGTRLASVSRDGMVRVWDVGTGREILIRTGHIGVAFSPDGTHLASGGGNHTVVWDLATGREALVLKGHTGAVWGVAFSLDGSRLASASWDGTVRVWDAATGREVLTLKGHTSGVLSVAFSPDGTRLASGGRDKTVRVWDMGTGRGALTLRGHTGGVSSVAFSPDGSRLASGGADGRVRVWDATWRGEALTLRGHTGQILLVAVSPDGTRLASTGDDGTLRVWDAATGREVLILKGHTAPVSGVAFCSDGTRLVVRYPNSSVKAWDLRTQKETPPPNPLPRFPGPRISLDGRFLAVPVGDVVQVFDTRLSEEELAYRRALAAPNPTRHAWEAAQAEQAGQWFAVLFHADRAERAGRRDHPLFLTRGRAHAERGAWDKARADFGRATALAPEDIEGWRRMALAHLGAGRTDAYRQACGRLLDFFQPTPEVPLATFLLDPVPGHAWGSALALKVWQDSWSRRRQQQRQVVRPAVVRPDAIADPVRLLTYSTQADPLTRGAALCRAGQHDEAVKLLEPVQEAAGLLYLALAEHSRGRPAAAQKALYRAVGWLGGSSWDDPERTNYTRLPWDERLEVDLLRREIEALLQGGKPTVDRKE
jgi:WD40 repeat protein